MTGAALLLGLASLAAAPSGRVFLRAVETPLPLALVRDRESGENALAQNAAPGRALALGSAPGESVAPEAAKEAAPLVRVERNSGLVRVTAPGGLLTEYRFSDADRPYFHPLLGPGGREMTRAFPMRDVAGEERDHPHHRSLWFAHGSVNGLDFWLGGENGPRIVATGIDGVVEGPVFGGFTARHEWRSPEGRVVLSDERVFRAFAVPEGAKLFDYAVTLRATHGPVVFGDTKEGTMALRLAETLRLTGAVASGRAVNARGVAGADVWGKRAEWIDYSGTVAGAEVGVAVFDHPSNPRHPTWWHARDYGLLAANPFGVHDFEKAAEGTGDFALASGESARFLYGFYLHAGGPDEARVGAVHRAWAAATAER